MKTLRDVLAIYSKEPETPVIDKNIGRGKLEGPVTPETRQRLIEALAPFRKEDHA